MFWAGLTIGVFLGVQIGIVCMLLFKINKDK